MDLKSLSKQIAYILRHAPWEYELELDEEGWVPLDQLLEGLRSERGMADVTREDVEEMIRSSDKARFEIEGEMIRAYYGHSVPGKLRKEKAEPPELLYHGTVDRFLGSIRECGLKPMSRQYVHLSGDTGMANIVARRRGKGIVILPIRAREASHSGVVFYRESNGVWLADAVGPEWIEFP